ncbi:Laminin subunit alpha-2 [Eumeta japonica]|uniref:Laminin subunit alpha-2 n=1 Tax=Eumeta variegata TaxID=151549 RepID=A0A4C1X576_EUMVA|nr:Laminin subunit alpha-2 [Eumeta japonica]
MDEPRDALASSAASRSLFAEARGGAAAGVEASRAWTRVSDALRDATAAADGAQHAARKATKLMHGPLPLASRARDAKDVSLRQKLKGEEVLKKAEDLRAELERLRRGTERVSVALRGLGWQERELGMRPQLDVSELLRVANEQSDRVFSTTRVLYDEASEFRRRARYNLRPQLAELQRHGDTALGAAQEHVSQIRGNTLRANEVAGALADAAEARAHEHHDADHTLGPALAQLRDKIARARHAADSDPKTKQQSTVWVFQDDPNLTKVIRAKSILKQKFPIFLISVSLTSALGQSVGCSRSYTGSAAPTAITRVTLAVSFEGQVRDGPLLWLGNREGQEEEQTYLQLLVKNQKLQLTWDLGDGEGIVDHSEVLQPTHDDLDHTSYRIDVERVWNTVRLSVERVGGGSGEPVVVSNTTGSHITLMAPELWLGSPKDFAGLPGCVHALYYDDKRLGLWNFVSQPDEMHCTGCTQRWYGGSRSGAPLVWFDGGGYAELHRSELRPPDRRHFSVALAFRTRDEDAVLFVTHDAANNRSLSISLRSCRVVFRVEYAAAALEIVAAGRHCHGRPVHVQAIRVFAKNNLEKGSLRVNGEETLGSPEPPVQDASALPNLANAPYWLGGVPPGALLAAPPLLGCLGALMVDREGYDLLNTPRRYGVEARCGNRVLRSVMLRGSGWVELPSPNIRRRTAIGLSFVAQQPRGLLLLRAPSTPETDNEVEEDDNDDQHHLSLALIDGELEVSATAGKSELRVRTNGSALSDGLLHTVRIVRVHKQLELWVDEQMVAHGVLAGGALAARPRGLYLGGLPAHLNATMKPRIAGFTGTITDLIVDGTLIGMENAVNWNNAGLGRARREPPDAPRAAPRPLHAPAPAAHCTKSSSYTVEPGAVKFGDAAHSHALLRPAARSVRDLALSMQFRTFRPDGLLLLAPGSKSKPKHYLALSLREGRLKLVVRGRRRRELSLQTPVADGAWRSVAIRVSPGRLVLASGGTATTAKPPRKLGLAARLYVGGLPDRAVIPNVPDNLSRASAFVGCVRRVSVGGRAEDLVRDAAHHHRVGQCFPRVEPAAFFAERYPKDNLEVPTTSNSKTPPSLGQRIRGKRTKRAFDTIQLYFDAFAANYVDEAIHGGPGRAVSRQRPSSLCDSGDAYTTWSTAWTGVGGAGAGQGGHPRRIPHVGDERRAVGGAELCTRNKGGGGRCPDFVHINYCPISDDFVQLVLTRRSPTGEQTKVECRGVAESALCDDSWHEAAARVSPSVLELSVDAGPARVVQPGQLLADEVDTPSAPAPLYVGGLPESASEWWSARENFKGCLRTITVGGERRDWPRMQELHNVLIDSCPIPQ